MRQKSHDGGVDLDCASLDGQEILCIQSKYTIRDVDDFDNIVSKFKVYQQRYAEEETKRISGPAQMKLKLDEAERQEDNISPRSLHFMVVTASDLRGAVARYEQSGRPSLAFYETLKTGGIIQVIDGPALVPILQKTYRKLHILPSNFDLHMASGYIRMGETYIGVVSGVVLQELYVEFGDALFLENIREFLGTQTDVNKEMLDTLEKEPERFLAKNNGITFRTSTVEEIDSMTLHLTEASIVNGYQTTMSVVRQPSGSCFVLAKVVSSERSWEIAKAANFQNRVDCIDLDLAEYIRPRDIRTAASRSGIAFKYTSNEEESVFAVLETIYQDQISYQEIRSLFIGLFSRNPNNTIDPDFSQLRTDVIEQLYKSDPRGDGPLTSCLKFRG